MPSQCLGHQWLGVQKPKVFSTLRGNVRVVFIPCSPLFWLFGNGSVQLHLNRQTGRQGHPKKHYMGQSPEIVPRTSIQSFKVPKTGVFNSSLTICWYSQSEGLPRHFGKSGLVSDFDIRALDISALDISALEWRSQRYSPHYEVMCV